MRAWLFLVPALFIGTLDALPTTTRVNVGGSSYVDSNGNTWNADSGCVSDSVFVRANTITGTLDPTIYQSGRESTSTLACSYVVAPGIYLVTLRFAETSPLILAAGQRTFAIYLNNVRVESALDVWSRSSFRNNGAIDLAYTVVAANGQVVAQLSRVSGSPFLCGIEIVLQSPASTAVTSGVWTTSSDYNWAHPFTTALVAATPTTLELSPCPLGVVGASTNWWLRLNDGASSENLQSTGLGTCVSGAASGTISFTPASNHSSGTVGSASCGIQEAVVIAGAGGQVFVPASCTVYGSIILTQGVTIRGSQFGTTLSASAASGQTLYVFTAAGTLSGSQNDISVSINTNRMASVSTSGQFASVAGWSTGNLLFLQDTNDYTTWGPATATITFSQIAKISGIVGTTVSFEQPIAIPMVTTHTGKYAQKIIPIQNITIDGFTLDGSANDAAAFGRGIYFTKCENVNLQNIVAQNFNESGIYVHEGYNIHEFNLSERATGSVSYAGIWNQFSTFGQATDLRSSNSGGFAIQFDGGVNWSVQNITISDSAERALKMSNLGRSNFSNISIYRAGTTGLAPVNGSWSNTFRGIHIEKAGGDAIWSNGQDNDQNIFSDLFIEGSGGFGIHLFTTDDDVSILDYAGNDAIQLDGDTNGDPTNITKRCVGKATTGGLCL